MPLVGLIPFLQYYEESHEANGKCVNALGRAHPISTQFKERVALLTVMCQCPWSGSSHFYCTLSKTPIKSAFPDTILEGISQNILKIKVFTLENGMFTICS